MSVDGRLPQLPEVFEIPEPPEPRVDSGSAGAPGPLGIPASMLKAYRNAADLVGKQQPGCRVDWALLASVGRIESNHARGGYVDEKGNTLERILGPALDGTGGFAAIRSSDGGVFTGDPVWDHAVGAMQFITGTWRQYASDGNGDGVSDPNNVYDETLAAGRYLCSGGLDLSSDGGQRIAVRRYNNSQSYVDTVMAWAVRYRGGAAELPDADAPIGAPPGKPAESAPSAVPVPQPPAAPTSAAPDNTGTANSPSSSAPATGELPVTSTKPQPTTPPTSPTPPRCETPTPDEVPSTLEEKASRSSEPPTQGSRSSGEKSPDGLGGECGPSTETSATSSASSPASSSGHESR
ncbi:lytic transglycosylase domain-containing protein [Amycolatopsis sp. WGS_07]|uniref:lytic transglycosylase domain-containing protein n=1 Tax=Amycolatopsis sp. WGS_07 TaxID=3076764 RepID=UPI003873290C